MGDFQIEFWGEEVSGLSKFVNPKKEIKNK